MHCNKLEKLGLYGAGNLSPDVFTRIWKHLPNLKILKVRYAHQITGQHIVELFELGKNVMRQIVLIDFTGCWKVHGFLSVILFRFCKITQLNMISDNRYWYQCSGKLLRKFTNVNIEKL